MLPLPGTFNTPLRIGGVHEHRLRLRQHAHALKGALSAHAHVALINVCELWPFISCGSIKFVAVCWRWRWGYIVILNCLHETRHVVNKYEFTSMHAVHECYSSWSILTPGNIYTSTVSCWAISLNSCTSLMTPLPSCMDSFSFHVCMSPCIVVYPIYVHISAYFCICAAILHEGQWIGNCMARSVLRVGILLPTGKIGGILDLKQPQRRSPIISCK